MAGEVGVRRFELLTPTSLTWCANRAALHPEHLKKPVCVECCGSESFNSGANINFYLSITHKNVPLLTREKGKRMASFIITHRGCGAPAQLNHPEPTVNYTFADICRFSGLPGATGSFPRLLVLKLRPIREKGMIFFHVLSRSGNADANGSCNEQNFDFCA